MPASRDPLGSERRRTNGESSDTRGDCVGARILDPTTLSIDLGLSAVKAFRHEFAVSPCPRRGSPAERSDWLAEEGEREGARGARRDHRATRPQPGGETSPGSRGSLAPALCRAARYLRHRVHRAVRERLSPYKIRWLEDCLIPEDFDGSAKLRRRLPWQTLASGEHSYTPLAFAHAVSHRLADVLQPDVQWAGGITALVKICHHAEAAGVQVVRRAGTNTAFGQHECFAMPNIALGEYWVAIPPGVSLDRATRLPGTAVPREGSLVPISAPGFGSEIDEAWLESAAR